MTRKVTSRTEPIQLVLNDCKRDCEAALEIRRTLDDTMTESGVEPGSDQARAIERRILKLVAKSAMLLVCLLVAGCCQQTTPGPTQITESKVSQKVVEPVIHQCSRQVWTFNGKTLTLESTGTLSATGRFDGSVLTLTVTTND